VSLFLNCILLNHLCLWCYYTFPLRERVSDLIEEAEVGSKPVFCELLPPIRSVWSLYDPVLVIYTKGNLYTVTLYSLLSRVGHLFSRPVMGD
jgi:hypothetical protein